MQSPLRQTRQLNPGQSNQYASDYDGLTPFPPCEGLLRVREDFLASVPQQDFTKLRQGFFQRCSVSLSIESAVESDIIPRATGDRLIRFAMRDRRCSTANMIALSQLTSGHRLPWANIRRNLPHVLSVSLGSQVTEAQIFGDAVEPQRQMSAETLPPVTDRTRRRAANFDAVCEAIAVHGSALAACQKLSVPVGRFHYACRKDARLRRQADQARSDYYAGRAMAKSLLSD